MEWIIHMIYLLIGWAFGMVIGCFYYKFKRSEGNLKFVTGMYESLYDKYGKLFDKVYIVNPVLEKEEDKENSE